MISILNFLTKNKKYLALFPKKLTKKSMFNCFPIISQVICENFMVKLVVRYYVAMTVLAGYPPKDKLIQI